MTGTRTVVDLNRARASGPDEAARAGAEASEGTISDADSLEAHLEELEAVRAERARLAAIGADGDEAGAARPTPRAPALVRAVIAASAAAFVLIALALWWSAR